MYSEALLTGQNLSLSEALAMGGQTTVIGLAIVFAVLIILMIVLSLFKVIFYKKPKTQAAPAAAPAGNAIPKTFARPIIWVQGRFAGQTIQTKKNLSQY